MRIPDAFPFVDVHPQTIAATLAVSSVPEAVTQAVVVILGVVCGEPPFSVLCFTKEKGQAVACPCGRVWVICGSSV